jgi:hypothetical protein
MYILRGRWCTGERERERERKRKRKRLESE